MTKKEWQEKHGFNDEVMERIDIIRGFVETKGEIVAVVDNPDGRLL